MNEGVNTSPLGVELQEGARRTKNGREIDGLLVVALQPGSPAERAGVQAGHREAHDVLEGRPWRRRWYFRRRCWPCR